MADTPAMKWYFSTMPRDPTEAMLIAARDWSHAKYGKPIGKEDATQCWQAMFDAALIGSTT